MLFASNRKHFGLGCHVKDFVFFKILMLSFSASKFYSIVGSLP
jgi:hypothetical protein